MNVFGNRMERVGIKGPGPANPISLVASPARVRRAMYWAPLTVIINLNLHGEEVDAHWVDSHTISVDSATGNGRYAGFDYQTEMSDAAAVSGALPGAPLEAIGYDWVHATSRSTDCAPEDVNPALPVIATIPADYPLKRVRYVTVGTTVVNVGLWCHWVTYRIAAISTNCTLPFLLPAGTCL